MATRRFKTVASLQSQLKGDIVQSIENEVAKMCEKVVNDSINKNVYQAYTPQGDHAYNRTFELLNAVTVGNIVVGIKYVTFEIYMDSEKINPRIRNGDDSSQWNAHASVEQMDVSEYIPLWIEEGTSGSLWDREGAYYMESAYMDLSGGALAESLYVAMRRRGWEVTRIS
jgi:hypothetical protein